MFQGIFSAIPTPFKAGKQEEIDFEALDIMLLDQLKAGIAGFVVYGTTGESVCLSKEEKRNLLGHCIAFCAQYAKEHQCPKVKVIAGVGTNQTSESIENARIALELGADGGLVVTPYYNKPTQQGLYLHFKAIAQATPDLPLIIYTVPGRTSVHLSIECIERLCEFKNIVAVKDATGDLVYGADLIKRCGHRLSMLSGDDPTFLPYLALGGKGAISVLSNLSPVALQKLWILFQDGDLAQCRALFQQLLPIARNLFIESNPIPIKQALEWKLKGFSADLRLPLCRMSEGNLIAFQQVYDAWLKSNMEHSSC